MTVYDLTRAQMEELKQDYLCNHLEEVEGRSPSWGELASADSIVSDAIIFETYGHYCFCNDDFFCSCRYNNLE